jgi:hypothetical protein
MRHRNTPSRPSVGVGRREGVSEWFKTQRWDGLRSASAGYIVWLCFWGVLLSFLIPMVYLVIYPPTG